MSVELNIIWSFPWLVVKDNLSYLSLVRKIVLPEEYLHTVCTIICKADSFVFVVPSSIAQYLSAWWYWSFFFEILAFSLLSTVRCFSEWQIAEVLSWNVDFFYYLAHFLDAWFKRCLSFGDLVICTHFRSFCFLAIFFLIDIEHSFIYSEGFNSAVAAEASFWIVLHKSRAALSKLSRVLTLKKHDVIVALILQSLTLLALANEQIMSPDKTRL